MRLLALFFMAFGCAIYFFTMDSAMKSLDSAGDIQAGSAETLSLVIAFLLSSGSVLLSQRRMIWRRTTTFV